MNGNRTTQVHTVGATSTTDTYCYDAGDRLTSTTAASGQITYDAHGNVTKLGGVTFTYDSLDRHVATTLADGTGITLERDVDGTILSRTVTGAHPEKVKYSGGVVEFYLNGTNQVTGTTQSLPGGVNLTTTGQNTSTSFTSLLGNACITDTGSTVTRTRFDPFGTPLTPLPDTLPGSAEPGFGAVADKLTDTLTPFGLIDMGSRIYSTLLGRFLQVDPVPGGGVNAYAYPPDPINTNDYSGNMSEGDWWVVADVATIALCFLPGGVLLKAAYTAVRVTTTVAKVVRATRAAAYLDRAATTIQAEGELATLRMARSKFWGVDSKLFGNSSYGTRYAPTAHGGLVNNKANSYLRLGWRYEPPKVSGIPGGRIYYGVSLPRATTPRLQHLALTFRIPKVWL